MTLALMWITFCAVQLFVDIGLNAPKPSPNCWQKTQFITLEEAD